MQMIDGKWMYDLSVIKPKFFLYLDIGFVYSLNCSLQYWIINLIYYFFVILKPLLPSSRLSRSQVIILLVNISRDCYVFQVKNHIILLSIFILQQQNIIQIQAQSIMSMPCMFELTNKSTYNNNQQLKNRQLKRFKLNYQYPARLSVAQHHQTASRIFAYNDNVECEMQRCGCCYLPRVVHKISVCEQLFRCDQDKSKNNDGRYRDNNATILFYILKITAIFYFLRTLLVQILRQTLLQQTKYCTTNQADCRLQNLNSLISLPTLVYSNPQLLQMQVFISAIAMVISIFFYIIYRYFLFKYYDQVSASHYDQEDYTLFVDNVSFLSILQAQISEDALNASRKVREKNVNLQDSFVDRGALRFSNNPQALIKSSLQLYFMSLVQKIKNRLQKKINEGAKLSQIQSRLFNRFKEVSSDDLKNILKEIVLCCDLNEIQRLQERVQKTMLEIQDIKQHNTYLDANSLNYTPKRVDFLIDKQLHLQKNYCRSVTSQLFLSRFLGCAFISFQYSELRDYLLEFHENNLRVFYDDVKFLKLQQAQAPQSIAWQNFKTSKVVNLKVQVESILVLTFLSAFFVFVIIIVKQLLENTLGFYFKTTSLNSIVSNLLFGLFLSILYTCILKLTQFLESKQTNSSQNNTLISRLIKSCIFGVLIVIISIAVSSQIIAHRSKQTPIKIIIVFSFFITFQTLYNLVPFSYILAAFRQWKYKSEQTIYAFQIQLNRQIRLKQFDIVETVIFQLTIIFVSSFFSHILSFRVASLGLLLLFNYLIFKCNLIKFYSIPKRITYRLTEIIIQMFEFQIILFGLGSFFSLITSNSNLIEEGTNYYFSFGLSAKYFIVAQLIVALLYKTIVLFWPRGIHINKQKKQLTFSQAYSKFPYHYEIQSPATKFCNNEEPKGTNLSFPFETQQQIQIMKKKSTSVDKQLIQSGNIQISREYSMSKNRGSFSVKKAKNVNK